MNILYTLTGFAAPTMGITSPPGVPTGVTLSSLAASFITFVYGVIGITFFALIIYAGFTWLTAAGNPDQTKKAVSILTSAVIGAFIALAAGAITGIFQNIFGITFQ